MTDKQIHEYGLTSRCVASLYVDGKPMCAKKHTIWIPKDEKAAAR